MGNHSHLATNTHSSLFFYQFTIPFDYWKWSWYISTEILSNEHYFHCSSTVLHKYVRGREIANFIDWPLLGQHTLHRFPLSFSLMCGFVYHRTNSRIKWCELVNYWWVFFEYLFLVTYILYDPSETLQVHASLVRHTVFLSQ